MFGRGLGAGAGNEGEGGGFGAGLGDGGAEGIREKVFECRGVTKVFGGAETGVQALRGVDLEGRAGELIMLVGPSGCGKTTLISVVAGLLKRSAGRCNVLGRDFDGMGDAEAARFRGRNIGFVFQAFNLIPALRAWENVATPLLINGLRGREVRERACAILGTVGFDGRMMEALPLDLSGGQQQRIVIARALVHGPRLVVCDEPTSALDSETGRRVMELMRELALTRGCTLLVVTHDARILEFGDRVARMEDGRIVDFEERRVLGGGLERGKGERGKG